MRIIPPTELQQLVQDWRRQGDDIAFTNGCFDLLHPGHIHLLRHARGLCHRLVLAVNSDTSVRTLKGPSRPIQPDWLRAELAGLIAPADAVVIFTTLTPRELLRDLRPDVLVKGSDYLSTHLPGSEHAGRVVLIERLPGYSTTNTLTQHHQYTLPPQGCTK